MNSQPDLENEWQRVWFSIRHHEWSSLALVPSHAGIDVNKVAELLAATGRRQGERPVHVVNGVGASLESVEEVISSVRTAAERGDWVIVPVDAIGDSPISIPIVRATSAALMVLDLGESLLASAQLALTSVGRERFLGSIILDGSRPALG